MSKIVEKELTKIFTPHQGNAIYTRKNVVSLGWQGDIPVISSDVDNDGILCYSKRHKRLHLQIQGTTLYFLAGRREC